jgi:hypothetical protein
MNLGSLDPNQFWTRCGVFSGRLQPALGPLFQGRIGCLAGIRKLPNRFGKRILPDWLKNSWCKMGMFAITLKALWMVAPVAAPAPAGFPFLTAPVPGLGFRAEIDIDGR